MRGIRGEDHTREEDIGLDAAIGEIEIEVIDAAQRNHGELKTGVVMNATEHEEPRRVESFLHDALARASLLQVTKTGLRLADHSRIGCGGLLQTRVEIDWLDTEIAERGGAQHDIGASGR